MNATIIQKISLIGVAVLAALLASVTQAKSYKSAEVYTQEEMQYGKYVIRMRAAKGSGVISNFFLWKEGSEMSNIFWEEVDIEVFGKDNAEVWQSNIITGLGSRITSEEYHNTPSSLADAYHTYELEWTEDYISWSLDGQEIRRSEGGQVRDIMGASTMRFNFWPPNIPAWVGPFSDDILPLEMYVNWVEYHSWNGNGFDLQWRDDFNTLDTTRWIQANHTFAENLADFVPENAVVKDGYLVLAMTHEGQEGYNGTPPADDDTGGGNPGGGNPGGDPGELTCTYELKNEWATGFTAEIVLSNEGDESQSNWDVSWSYSGNNQVVNSWNATLSTSGGTYTAKALSWNSTINPGQSVSFGFVGQKGTANTPAEVPAVSGSVCE